MILNFVAEHYPDFLKTYCNYEAGIRRADAARYMLLHHFGGVYADLDCECVAPFAPIMAEDRVVLCCEPTLHTYGEAQFRGLPHLLFNGTMVSPPGHAFWPHLMSYLPNLAQAKDVLDATGPYVLTSAQLSFADQGLSGHPSPQPLCTVRSGRQAGKGGGQRKHQNPFRPSLGRNVVFRLAQIEIVAGSSPPVLSGQVSADARQATGHGNCAPRGRPGGPAARRVRRSQRRRACAASRCGRPYRAVSGGDGSDRLSEGAHQARLLRRRQQRWKLGTASDSRCAARKQLPRHRAFAEASRDKAGSVQAHQAEAQRSRRSGIAKVRNHLIEHGLDANDDWALWIDIDVWQFPANIVTTLIRSGHTIVTPNCVKTYGGRSFDLNSFVTTRPERDPTIIAPCAAGSTSRSRISSDASI